MQDYRFNKSVQHAHIEFDQVDLKTFAHKVSLIPVRQLFAIIPPALIDADNEPEDVRPLRSCCGERMVFVEISNVSSSVVRL